MRPSRPHRELVPYDHVVVACLRAAERMMGDQIEISSDASLVSRVQPIRQIVRTNGQLDAASVSSIVLVCSTLQLPSLASPWCFWAAASPGSISDGR